MVAPNEKLLLDVTILSVISEGVVESRGKL